VSYDLEASHFGPADRCDCFTMDPALPAGFTHLSTADYTGAGAYAGYGIDRGHMVRSADRTAGSLDNATTYYLSNIVPQAAGLNQGPWAVLENYLGDQARDGSHEVYVIAGVDGSLGTLKGEGKVVIPSHVWKVAVILPRDAGLGSVHSLADLQVVAVDMPNQDSIRKSDWQSFRTTVDAIEAESGYDVLSKLPDDVEWLLEAGITSPSDAPAGAVLDVLSGGVRELVAQGTLSGGEADALQASLAAAKASLERGNAHSARGQLGAFDAKVEAMVRSGRLSPEEGRALTALSARVGQGIS
jgi:endonuclease G